MTESVESFVSNRIHKSSHILSVFFSRKRKVENNWVYNLSRNLVQFKNYYKKCEKHYVAVILLKKPLLKCIYHTKYLFFLFIRIPSYKRQFLSSILHATNFYTSNSSVLWNIKGDVGWGHCIPKHITLQKVFFSLWRAIIWFLFTAFYYNYM